MATYPKVVWDQLRGLEIRSLERALRRDGWELQKAARQAKGRKAKGANTLTYRHPSRPHGHNIVVLHPHPKKEFGPKLLKSLMEQIGWTPEELKSLGLIKKLPVSNAK